MGKRNFFPSVLIQPMNTILCLFLLNPEVALIFKVDMQLIKGSSSNDAGSSREEFIEQLEDGGFAEAVGAVDDGDAFSQVECNLVMKDSE
jgi:hypothetical protein